MFGATFNLVRRVGLSKWRQRFVKNGFKNPFFFGQNTEECL